MSDIMQENNKKSLLEKYPEDIGKAEEPKLTVDNIVSKPLINDDDIDSLISDLDEVARDINAYEFGLPIMQREELIDCFKKWYEAL